MTEELHFEVIAEEGERHPSEGHELRKIIELLEQIQKRQHYMDHMLLHLLQQIIKHLKMPTYFQPTGGSISVTE